MMRTLVVMMIGVSLAISARAGDALAPDTSEFLDRLFPSQQTECPEGLASNCLCGEIGNLSELPTRYSLVHACPHALDETLQHVRTYTAAGAPVDDMMWRGGKLHGAAISWHPNGQVAGIAGYEEGRQIGPTRGWHENGRPAFEQHYIDGQPHGTEIRYTPGGEIETVVVWEHGTPDREATRRLAGMLGIPAPFDRRPTGDSAGR